MDQEQLEKALWPRVVGQEMRLERPDEVRF